MWAEKTAHTWSSDRPIPTVSDANWPYPRTSLHRGLAGRRTLTACAGAPVPGPWAGSPASPRPGTNWRSAADPATTHSTTNPDFGRNSVFGRFPVRRQSRLSTWDHGAPRRVCPTWSARSDVHAASPIHPGCFRRWGRPEDRRLTGRTRCPTAAVRTFRRRRPGRSSSRTATRKSTTTATAAAGTTRTTVAALAGDPVCRDSALNTARVKHAAFYSGFVQHFWVEKKFSTIISHFWMKKNFQHSNGEKNGRHKKSSNDWIVDKPSKKKCMQNEALRKWWVLPSV